MLFSTATDSPVREDSSTFRERASSSLASAGIRSPACKIKISPGTSREEGTFTSFPSLTTRASGLVNDFKSLIDSSALYS